MTWAPLTVLLFLAVLFFLERKFPLRERRSAVWPRIAVNLFFSFLTYGTAFLIVKPIMDWALGLSQGAQFGLLQWIRLGIIPEAAVSILLLDLSFYYWHRLNHTLPWLWRFHNVHHLDPDLDVTTAFRFHFGEVALSSVFRAAQLLFLGVPPWTLPIFEVLFQSATYFHHSNLRLPLKLERGLNRFLVSPRLHGIHHSQRREETNSNYSVIFTWWDLLHGTFRQEVREGKLTIGVPGYDRPEDNQIPHAITIPFERQRDYWPRA